MGEAEPYVYMRTMTPARSSARLARCSCTGGHCSGSAPHAGWPWSLPIPRTKTNPHAIFIYTDGRYPVTLFTCTCPPPSVRRSCFVICPHHTLADLEHAQGYRIRGQCPGPVSSGLITCVSPPIAMNRGSAAPSPSAHVQIQPTVLALAHDNAFPPSLPSTPSHCSHARPWPRRPDLPCARIAPSPPRLRFLVKPHASAAAHLSPPTSTP